MKKKYRPLAQLAGNNSSRLVKLAKAAFATILVLGPHSALAAEPAGKGCAPPPKTSVVVNVRERGAKGNGKADDTSALQAAIDEAAVKGGTVLVPNGRYMVDATRQPRLSLKSNVTLRLAPGAVLQVIPTEVPVYSLLTIKGAKNVTIEGGTLEGDRDKHKGTTGEWGMGVRIGPDAENVTISGVTARKLWGDGFYVAGARNVVFCAVVADFNRRQGLSVIAADGLQVVGSVFKNTRGTRPSAGIDLEPNNATEKIRNIRIESSKFLANAGPGILIAGKKGEISELSIVGNTFEGTVPIVVENAREVDSREICRNRVITHPPEPSGGLAPVVEPTPTVIVQSECGDSRIIIRRGKKKKG